MQRGSILGEGLAYDVPGPTNVEQMLHKLLQDRNTVDLSYTEFHLSGNSQSAEHVEDVHASVTNSLSCPS